MIDKTLILNKIKEKENISTNKAFAEFLEIKPTTLAMWYKRNTFDIELIFKKCEYLNAEWLLTGKGNMLKEEKEVNVRMLRTDTVIATSQHVPYYNISATASIVEAFTSEAPEIPIEHISIPNLPKCDGALNVTGDSMYPLLKSGDIVMYRNVNDVGNIIWGEMYLMYLNCHGDEFFFCKYIHKAEKEGFVKLVSQNKHHEAKEFPINCIKQLAIVKASIRINSVI